MGCEFLPMIKKLADFKFDGNKSYVDGPHAITDIRNGITHPKKAKRDRLEGMSQQLRYEASELGLFYLECSMLGLCGYFGPFRADPVCGALYKRQPIQEPVYQKADFSKLLPDDNQDASDGT